jgi:Domain of unknown function (DUF4157)
MVSDSAEQFETLGQRLHRQGVRLMSMRRPEFAWLAPARQLLEHVVALPGPTAGRFDRIEPDGLVVDFHDLVSGARPPGHADGDPPASRALPSDVRAQLHRVIGLDASAMRIHDDRAADRIARTHRADAVTVGRDVYFRAGRFRPRQPDGFGLVAHEATHVAELSAPGAAWRRLTRGGQRDEERLAEANERRARHDGRPDAAETAVPPRHPDRSRPPMFGAVAITAPTAHYLSQPWSPPPAEVSTTPARQPMAAAEERAADAPAQLDVDALRRSLFQDLKDLLRSEFERGA